MEKKKIILDIKKMGINGEGIAYYLRKAYFVSDAIPGEKVAVEITSELDKHSVARVTEYITKSPYRRSPFCKIYSKCGGCNIQHIDYQKQGEYKRELIIEAFSRYTKVNPRGFEIKKTIVMNEPRHYRAKSSLPIRYVDGKIAMGMYAPNSNILIPIDKCAVHNKELDAINLAIRNAIGNSLVAIYDQKTKKGIIKAVITRISFSYHEAQVTLIMQKDADIEELVKEILEIPNVVGVFKSINNEDILAPKFGKEILLQAGNNTIREKIGDFIYELTPGAFFQLNPIQTFHLYEEIKKACKLSLKEVVVDCYSGAGTIGIYVSRLAKEVISIEMNKHSIDSALVNAQKNKVKNISFIQGDVEECLADLFTKQKIDVVIFDPPRTGLNDRIIEMLNTNKPAKIIYVSCNPSTFTKDLSKLEATYSVKYIQPLDMFPWTAHVELIAVLSSK